MSTPAQPLIGSRPFVQQDGSIGWRCCDDRAAVPLWVFLSPFGGSNAAGMRRSLIEQGIDPDVPWCHKCATVLEDVRDGFQAGGGTFLQLLATVASFVPGVGTAAATVLGVAAALANGKNISDALVNGALSAVPGGVAWSAAGAAAKSILRGERIDKAGLAAAREAIRYEGGDVAAAAFDGLMALAQGKNLQESGFAVLGAYAQGNDLQERAAHYAEAITVAAEEGRAVKDVLVESLAYEVHREDSQSAIAEKLQPLVNRVVKDPALRNMAASALGFAFNVSEPLARSAQAVVDANGRVDQNALDLIVGKSGTQSAIDKYGAGVVASRATNQTLAETNAAWRSDMLDLAIRTSPAVLSFRTAMEEAGTPLPPPPAERAALEAAAVVAAPAPASRSTLGQDLLLGVTVAAAVGALFWWATSGKTA